MAGTPTAIYPQTVKDYAVQILPADTTSTKTICSGATNGTLIESLIVTSTDTADRVVTLYKTISAVAYPIGTFTIPLTSGTAAAVTGVDLLRQANISGLPYDTAGNKVLFVPSGTTLGIACTTTVTTAKAINAVASGMDF